MKRRDYYMVLGVSRDESPRGIKEAFRNLAMRYHPDRAGLKWTERFREIMEAYEVLGNAERRRDYNDGLDHASPIPIRRKSSVAPEYRAQPEPLIPERIPSIAEYLSFSEAFDALLHRFAMNFSGIGIPKAETAQSLDVELIISKSQAVRGGAALISVPAYYPCRYCRGTGYRFPKICSWCGGGGMLEEQEKVRLMIPAGVRDGAVLEIPLRGMGVHNLYLKAVVRLQ
ncbi:DnaJ domain-containing protein [Desulfatibacillum aliphaticivorans]|uniref:DnaJ domain-containing protein n=1 Tax=Desulfatibacillum aliphaticivorans TaxID=218208 RepID=UPI000402D413|nr:DnaJ domain-containing protein [Desulfatibacillum aliphaticivorans]